MRPRPIPPSARLRADSARWRRPPALGLAGLLLTLAATALAAPPRDLRRAEIRAWSTRDGLPEEYISGITESEDGYLWLATRDGLVRFDGRNFRTFQPAERAGIHDSGTGAVAADGQTLWIGGRDYMAVARADRYDSFTQLDIQVVPFPRPPSERFGVATLHLDGRGQALLHRTDGIFRWDGRSPPERLLAPPAGELIQGYSPGRAGRHWITTSSGLWLAEGGAWRRLAGGPQQRASLIEARDGSLWTLDERGLWHTRREGGRWRSDAVPLRSHPNMASFQGLLEDDSGAIWVGVPGGLARLRGGEAEEFPLNEYLRPDDTLQSLFQSRDGAIWGGSRWGTLIRIEARLFEFVDQNEGLRDSAVSALAEDSEGRMWIGSRIGGAAVLANGRWRPVPGTANGILGAMARLSDGRILGTSTRGLWVGDARGVRPVVETHAAGGASFRALSPDYGTHIYFNDDTRIYRLALPLGAQPRAEPVAEAKSTRGILEIDDELWAVSWDQGLVLTAHGETTVYPLPEHGERHGMTLFPLTRDLLVVGTNTGLFGFDRRARRFLSSPPAFRKDQIFFVEADGRDNLWFLGRKALLTAPRQALIDYFGGRRATVLPYRLTAHQGLRSTNFGLGTSSVATVARDGEIWMASLAGALSFKPEAVVTESERVRCAVDEVEADGMRIPLDQVGELAAGTRRLSVQYTVLDRKAGQNPIFRYRLVGDPTGWVETSGFQAVFTNLRSGNYRFEVQARVSSLEWSNEAARLDFTIPPYWYERPWVQWTELAGLSLLMWAWSRYRALRMRRQTEQLEARVRARTEELALARDEAERARQRSESDARVKSEFLANMSHEIRTPLNGVIGMTELALNTELTAAQREYIGLAKLSADSLLTVINDVLDFSRIEAGKMPLDPRPFPVREVVERTVAMLSLSAQRKGIGIGCTVDPGVPEVLTGDAGRLRQVLLNLTGNAIKFTERGGVTVRVEAEELDLSAESHQVQLRFAIADTGIGIPLSEHRRIFHAFEQADGSTTRRHGGTGLGLTISSRLVQLMGGNIWLESEPGRGSTFWFTVRLEQAPEGVGRELAQLAAGVGGLRAIVMDGDLERRRRIAEAAGRLGLECVTLADAEAAAAALAAADSVGRPFSLLLAGGETALDDAVARALPQIRLASAAEMPETLAELLAAAQPAPDSGTPLPGARRLLLAEDNAVNQRLAVRLLESRGYAVTVADNGRAAIEAWQREHFDLLLFDVQMPEMDGLEAAAEIRRRENGGTRTPIIALTAGAFKEDRERCLAAGMDDYVTKPIQSRELFERLERWLQLAARAAG